MINKQSIWFTFLFSIILVLSIFYISMDDEKIIKANFVITNRCVNFKRGCLRIIVW